MLVKLGGGGGGRDDSGGGCDYGGFGGRCWSYREKGVGGGEREAVTSTVVLGVGPVDGLSSCSVFRRDADAPCAASFDATQTPRRDADPPFW